MSFPKIYIVDYDCLSPAGHGLAVLLDSLHGSRSHLAQDGTPQGSLPDDLNEAILSMQSEKSLRDQDKASLMALYLARSLSSSLPMDRNSTGVVIGSSRGPTRSLEKAWERFASGQRLSPSTSPSTTASAIASIISRDLKLEGPSFSLSAACSTGLYAVIQGIANLIAQLASSMLVGGVEAANTDFTLAMLQATKVLNADAGDVYPCRPGHPQRSGMALSEGGALLKLGTERPKVAHGAIIGWGAATESGTLTGVSEDGRALKGAIAQALRIAGIHPNEVDFIVGHGSGTQKGDGSELEAYGSCFGEMPPLVWHKWCNGHMLGASAALSVMLACEHLKSGMLPPHPYLPEGHPMKPRTFLSNPKIALITSMGFGGSACALLVKNLL